MLRLVRFTGVPPPTSGSSAEHPTTYARKWSDHESTGGHRTRGADDHRGPPDTRCGRPPRTTGHTVRTTTEGHRARGMDDHRGAPGTRYGRWVGTTRTTPGTSNVKPVVRRQQRPSLSPPRRESVPIFPFPRPVETEKQLQDKL